MHYRNCINLHNLSITIRFDENQKTHKRTHTHMKLVRSILRCSTINVIKRRYKSVHTQPDTHRDTQRHSAHTLRQRRIRKITRRGKKPAVKGRWRRDGGAAQRTRANRQSPRAKEMFYTVFRWYDAPADGGRIRNGDLLFDLSPSILATPKSIGIRLYTDLYMCACGAGCVCVFDLLVQEYINL